jgi:hypothetical protein
MLVYPQLPTGTLVQFPVGKRRRMRTAVNVMADGSSIKLADPPGEFTEWTLRYSQLSDEELAAIQQFFTAAEGSLNSFTFLDPNANLLAWSDQLQNAAWVRGPFLSVTGGPTIWHLNNTGAGPQSLAQTIAAPARYLYCFSADVRAAQPSQVTMLLGNQRADRTVGTGWNRIQFAASGAVADDSVTFGLEVPAGLAIDVSRLQSEPQAAASAYKSSTTGGVYEGARLRDDVLTITATGVNQHSCTVSIYHANHL